MGQTRRRAPARRATAVIVLAALSAVSAACGPAKVPKEAPAVAPRSLDDVVGIWRTVHQSVLELRSNGTFVLISSRDAPDQGRFVLDADRLQFGATRACTSGAGSYSVRLAVHARMRIDQPDDGCAVRRRILTGDPWVYTPR